VAAPVPSGSPAYVAGLERDDVIISVGGRDVTGAADVIRAIREQKPGDMLPIVFERRGQRITGTVRLGTDPLVEIRPIEEGNRQATADERRFREGWLRSAARNAF
jgi:S1-C subfamily serine protease